MLRHTEQLIHLLHSQPRLSAAILQAYCQMISTYGDREDAAALFKRFLEQPEDYRHVMLLGPVMRCGDLALAQEIDRHCFEQNKLKREMPSAILHVLGYLGCEKYVDYMVDCIEMNDWDLSKDACLSLMHLPLEPHHEERLREEFEKVYGEPLFPEFLPALSFKFSGPEIVPRLLAWGERASTDCNAGIVLGIAAYGESQRETMKQLLWNPGWELYAIGTGSHWWAYMGMQMVKLSFRELILDIKKDTPLEQEERDSEETDMRLVEHKLDVLHDLLDLKLSRALSPLRFVQGVQEDLTQLYTLMFEWSTVHRDDSFLGRIGRYFGQDHPLVNKYFQLSKRMEEGIFRELERDLLQMS